MNNALTIKAFSDRMPMTYYVHFSTILIKGVVVLWLVQSDRVPVASSSNPTAPKLFQI